MLILLTSTKNEETLTFIFTLENFAVDSFELGNTKKARIGSINHENHELVSFTTIGSIEYN